MKRIDLFLGIKAEQTLRDAVRAAAEESTDDADVPELCPVGKKDWIAGKRLSTSLVFGQIEEKKRAVIKNLIGLQSHQRIRQESIRIYAVRPPVPVFKDTIPEGLEEEPVKEQVPDTETVACPVCGVEVHKYNIQYDPWGKMVGCYLCRGEAGNKNG